MCVYMLVCIKSYVNCVPVDCLSATTNKFTTVVYYLQPSFDTALHKKKKKKTKLACLKLCLQPSPSSLRCHCNDWFEQNRKSLALLPQLSAAMCCVFRTLLLLLLLFLLLLTYCHM